MSFIDAPILPSPGLRQHYAFGVVERISTLKASLHVPVLDGLGDLALAFGRRGIHRWCGPVEDFAALMAPRWAPAEATTIIEVAEKIGLFTPMSNGFLRPREVGHFIWLGARRVALTRDEEELIDHALRGPLFDMFAMAPSLVTEEGAAAELVRIYHDRAGQWESLLECGVSLAAAAVSWGAPATSELRYRLLTRAEEWVTPLGASWNREIGTAILVRETQGGEFGGEVLGLAESRLETLLEDALSDEELATNPAILESVSAQLAIIVAGHGLSEEKIASLVARMPAVEAHRVARAVAQVVEPSKARNDALVFASLKALEAGNDEALGELVHLAEPLAGVIGPIHDVFQHNIEFPPTEDLSNVYRAMAACRAIAHWTSCPELTLHLLSRLIASPRVDPDLRIAAAQAFSKHMASVGRPREILLETLHGQLELVDRAQAIASTVAALHLGSSHIRLGALALAMVADGGPSDLLGQALDAGTRMNPMHFATFEETLSHYQNDPHMLASALLLIGEFADNMQKESSLGPFFSLPAHTDLIHYGLARILLPLVNDAERPDLSADAATACGWALRGDLGYALTCLNLRELAREERFRALYDLALGSTGVADPRIIARLGEDCAYGPPDLSAAAAVALRVLLERIPEVDGLEGVLDVMRERADFPGPQQGAIRLLLHQLVTMPLIA